MFIAFRILDIAILVIADNVATQPEVVTYDRVAHRLDSKQRVVTQPEPDESLFIINGLVRNHVDHAGRSITTIQRALWAFQNFNTGHV